MPLISTADYPAIRSAIDLSLTTADLPDATIAASVCVSQAEAAVLRRDPEAAGRTGDEGDAVVAAVVLLAAACLMLALPAAATVKEGSASYTPGQLPDVEKRAAALRAMAWAALDDYLGVSVPGLFTTAAGYRGR